MGRGSGKKKGPLDKLDESIASSGSLGPAEFFARLVHTGLVDDAGAATRRVGGAAKPAESVLPKDFEDAQDEMTGSAHDSGDSGAVVTTWALAVGAVHECDVCGNHVVQSETLVEELISRWKANGTLDEADEDRVREELRGDIDNSGAEVGTWETSDLCSYHANQIGNDD